ncbi:MAG: hypothetical protein NC927_01125 [Candidatus Omnitrophica bacterium]|nr:hypothetical protein [Candidatus Omnitrophota bacterium]
MRSFFLALILGFLLFTTLVEGASRVVPLEYPDISGLEDDKFLDLVQKKAFEFFWYEANPENGLIKDRANNFGPDEYKISSIASVGFGLTALCIAEKRGWLTHEEAYNRVLTTLKFLKEKMKREFGFYYHFVHMDNGEPLRKTEVSSIDTALFLAGALFCGEFYKGTEVEKLAVELYREVEWDKMLNGGTTLSMGWKPAHLPDAGFIADRWSYYSEAMILYLLAIGSPSHPIPSEYWFEWMRPIRKYKDFVTVSFPALFAHQYSHLWIDFRNKNDGICDYFQNSVNATLANRQFCIDNMSKYKTYGPDSWGLTACDGPEGYSVYGAPPSIYLPKHDGTIAPTAAGGSLMFTPQESISCLRNLYTQHKEKIWGIYGFSDAFNLDKNWFASDVIGIDLGAIVLSIENYRSGMVWDYFMRNEFIKKAMEKVGFKEGTKNLVWEIPQVKARFTAKPPKLDADLKEWKEADYIELIPQKHLEYLYVTDTKVDLRGKFYFMWDKEALYVAAEVVDNEIIARMRDNLIYKDDCIEIFIDPKNDGFIFRNPDDFQFGFAPTGFEGKPIKWEWFHQDKFQDKIDFAMKEHKLEGRNGYILEAKILWEYLGIEPEKGVVFGISPAIHDVDELDNSPQAKLNWFYIYQVNDPRIILGQILLE